MIEDLIFFLLSFQLGWVAWKALHDTPHLLEHMQCDPNTWRWWDQILLRLHKRPFSFQTLQALTWIVVINVLYIWLQPVGVDLIMFLLVLVAVSAAGYVRQSPMYLLIFLVAKVHPVFLYPLFLVKEIGGWFGIGVLLVQGSIVEAVVVGGVAGLLYLLLRDISGKKPIRLEDSAPFFAPRFALETIRKRPLLVLRDLSVTAMIFLVYFWQMPFLFLWLAGPLLLFSLPWESHLWFPLMILALGVI